LGKICGPTKIRKLKKVCQFSQMGKSADYDWFKSNFPYNKDNWGKFADQRKSENKKSMSVFPFG
jgi:hypothetical protein